jgi:hypothetical protein
MKSTEIARRDREFKREKKRQEVLGRRQDKKEITVGDYIDNLHALFFHDDKRIFNTTKNNDPIVDLIGTMKIELPERQWENVLRKAVKKTGIADRETAFKELKEVLDTL